MFLTSREALLACKPKVVKVPVEGGEVFVRGFTPEAGEAWDFLLMDGTTKRQTDPNYKIPNIGPFLFCWTVCDEEGNLLFTPEDVEQVAKTVAQPIVDAVEKKANEINLLTKDARDNAAKNSQGAENSSSGSSCQVDGDAQPVS